MWFCVAIFYTYGDFLTDFIKGNQDLHYLSKYAQYSPSIAFMLYSGTFVITIATMQVGHIKFQLNQLCWTIVVICLTVGQLKYIMHNIFNGLFWFALPIFLVVMNDIMAYVSGMTFGRKFIHRPFITFSPNKTWEGFIGGGIFTLIGGWYLSRFFAQFTWLTCPMHEFRVFPGDALECELDPIFLPSQYMFPPQMFELLPRTLVKMIPNIVEICRVVDGNPEQQLLLTACISGSSTLHYAHDHFELVLKNVYPVQIHALSLAFFASVVAPFGGFLASAIKRAYGLKDFDSIIPGHGGVMDRMDCQFLMALCTWVHYNTFVKMATISVPKMLYMYDLLTLSEQVEFLDAITRGGNRQQQQQRHMHAYGADTVYGE
jgi:phosphatidate cytidylyltransferase